MGTVEKQCVICAKSCAGQARIKDAQGNYAHKACAEKQQAKKQAAAQKQPELEPLDLGPEEEPDMAAFLDDLPSESSEVPGGLRSVCPGCGVSVGAETVVCMSCGCNTKTGKGMKTKVAKVRSGSAGAGIAAKAGGMAITPFLPIIGAVIGGAIGSAVWAAIVYFTGYEVGLVAAGVGAVCGIGAAVTSGGGNAWAGTVAVVVALLSIVFAKVVVNEIYVSQLQTFQETVNAGMGEEFTLDLFTSEEVIEEFADDMIFDMQDNNQEINWPTAGMTWSDSVWPSDYPKDIIAAATDRWEAMSPEEQLDYRQTRVDEMKSYAQEFNEMMEEEMESASNASVFDNLNYFDALWALLALGAAWQCGSGED